MFEFHYQQYMLLNYSLHFFGQLPLVQLYIYRDSALDSSISTAQP